MHQINYSAFDKKGEEISGVIEAASIGAAIDILKSQGVTPYKTQIILNDSIPWWNKDLFSNEKLSDKEKGLFARELSTYLDAGLSIDDALNSILLQLRRPSTITIIESLIAKIRSGQPLSVSMEELELFLPVERSLIYSGEQSGDLAFATQQIANMIERENNLRGEVSSALLYPAILLTLSIASIIFILTVMLPNLRPIFADAGDNIPGSTKFLLSLGDFVSQYWEVILLSAIGVIIVSIYAFRNFKLRSLIDEYLFKIPLIGTLKTHAETSRLNRSLGMLISSGVSIPEALRVVRSVNKTERFKIAIGKMENSIKAGHSFIQAYEDTNIFSLIAVRLAAVGDKSGTLPAMLIKAADILEHQVKKDTDRLVNLLTPALTILTGIIVGGMVLVVLSSILSVNDLAF